MCSQKTSPELSWGTITLCCLKTNFNVNFRLCLYFTTNLLLQILSSRLVCTSHNCHACYIAAFPILADFVSLMLLCEVHIYFWIRTFLLVSSPSFCCRCCSCRWSDAMSINRGHQLAYCSSSRWYMHIESCDEMILTGQNRLSRRITCSSATLSTNLHMDWPGLDPEHPRWEAFNCSHKPLYGPVILLLPLFCVQISILLNILFSNVLDL
jgi:hypothetical protein